jgi:hypothetical protein
MSMKVRLSRPTRAESASSPSRSKAASLGASALSASTSSEDLEAEVERKERYGHSLENLKTSEQPAGSQGEPLGTPQLGGAAPIQFGGRNRKDKNKNRDRDSKSEKTKRKTDWRDRRDRKQIGKSAGPLDVVAESRTKLPLQRDEVRSLPSEGRINPHRIRTIQSTATDHFSDGQSVMGTVRDLTRAKRDKEAEAPDIDPIEIMRHKGKAFTLDNRRLYAHRRAGVPVNYKMVDSGRAEQDFSRKFSTKDDGMSMKIVPSSGSTVPYAPEDLYPDSEDDLNVNESYSSDEEDFF